MAASSESDKRGFFIREDRAQIEHESIVFDTGDDWNAVYRLT